MKKILLLSLLFFINSCSKSEEIKKEYEGSYTSIEAYNVTNLSTLTFVYPISSTCEVRNGTINLKAYTQSKLLFEKSISFTENNNYVPSIGFYVGSKMIGSYDKSSRKIMIDIKNQDTYLGYKVDFSCFYQ